MKLEKELISPEKAKYYLGDRYNRKVRKAYVRRLARAMSEGRWKLIDDPIKFNGNGKLVGGQHRLLAVIESGTSQEFWVKKEVEDFDIMVEGSNTPWSAADVLDMKLFPQPSLYSKSAMVILRWQRNIFFPRAGDLVQMPDNSEIADYAIQHRNQLAEIINFCLEIKRKDQHNLNTFANMLEAHALISTFTHEGSQDLSEKFFLYLLDDSRRESTDLGKNQQAAVDWLYNRLLYYASRPAMKLYRPIRFCMHFYAYNGFVRKSFSPIDENKLGIISIA